MDNKKLKEFVKGRKKLVIDAMHSDSSEDCFHWWNGYQIMLWELELFLEGEEINGKI